MTDPENNQQVYLAWKQLRNRLSNYNLYDSLAVIQWYFASKQSQFDLPIPSDLRPHPDINDPRQFLPWELETLAREVIITCPESSAPRYTMRNPDHLAQAMNYLMGVNTAITREYINKDNIRHELSVRLAHRQFKYSTERPNMTNLVRYFKVFSDPDTESYVMAKIGLSTRQIYTIGTTLWSMFCQHSSFVISGLTTNVPGVSKDDINTFISYFGAPIEEVRMLLSGPEQHPMNDKFEYAYSSQYAFPIMTIKVDGESAIICPIQTLLAWRYTSGLYYDLCGLKINGVDFGSVFGLAYEKYIGGVLATSLSPNQAKISQGEPNNGANPNTCDWIIETDKEVMLVETKVKRLSMAAKTSLISQKDLDEQLEILAKAIIQVYRSFIAYRDSSYRNPRHVFNSSKRYFVSVVTLEKWYLMGDQIDKLRTMIAQKLSNMNIDPSLVKKVPYVVMSSDDIERLAYLLGSRSMEGIINPYWDGQDTTYSGFEFSVYLSKVFADELKSYEYVHADEENSLFTVPL